MRHYTCRWWLQYCTHKTGDIGVLSAWLWSLVTLVDFREWSTREVTPFTVDDLNSLLFTATECCRVSYVTYISPNVFHCGAHATETVLLCWKLRILNQKNPYIWSNYIVYGVVLHFAHIFLISVWLRLIHTKSHPYLIELVNRVPGWKYPHC